MTEALTLYELNALVAEGVHAALPDEYWVQAELSEAKVNYSGHCYLELVQHDERTDALVAKARGVVWANTFKVLKPYFEQTTGHVFAAGLKVLVCVTAEFHELYGYTLVVTDIDPTYTLGGIEARRKEILQRLEKQGILELNQELQLSEFAQRIAVVSSATAAGYEDFCNQVQHNAYGYDFRIKLFPALMQGTGASDSVIQALNAVFSEIENWDVVVMIRGGGATSDLSCFDTYELAENCAQFPLPIVVGIGHERDTTVLDSVAYTSVKTPTAAAEFLIHRLHDTDVRLQRMAAGITGAVGQRMNRERSRLDRIMGNVPVQIKVRIMSDRHRLDTWQERQVAAVWNRLKQETYKLDMLNEKLQAASPERILKRGYSITLHQGKVVTDASKLKPGDKLETKVMNGTIHSKVTQ